MESKTVIGVIFWGLLAAFIIPGYIFGFQKLFAVQEKVENFKRWGYSTLFMRLLGLGEIAAATGLLFSQTRLLGFIFFFIIFTGAVLTDVKSKDPVKETMTPVFVAVHLMLIFFSHVLDKIAE